ncbi:type II secretion system F family protein [Alkaliphilus serpentinus]|nr:type II secretion system F family protein [Alkaliphilus serpentinus]
MVFIFIILTLAIIAIHFISKDRYKETVEGIDQKDFQLKKFLHIGLYLLEITKYKYNTPYDKRLKSNLGELYGARSSAFYLKIHWANTLTLVFMILLLASLVGISFIGNEGSPEDLRDNTIERPDFGEGDRKLQLVATFKSKEGEKTEEVSVVVKEESPTDEEAVTAAIKKLSPKIILGKNPSLNDVTSELNFIKEIPELGVKINWRSSKPEVINEMGAISSNNNNGKEVVITAILFKGNSIAEKQFKLVVKDLNLNQRPSPTPKEEAVNIINSQMEDYSNTLVTLPSNLKENSTTYINWAVASKKDSSILNLIFFLTVVIAGIIYALNNEVKEKLKKRNLLIQIDFPDFLNKFILLINAGMNVPRALEKIIGDTQSDRPLYRELKLTYSEIKAGKSELQAYEDFAIRCKTTEITKFVSTLIQNLKKGNTELTHILKLHVVECWNLRKSIAKQLGEEASTKLLFPIMIMFIAILLIVLTPAVLTLSSM